MQDPRPVLSILLKCTSRLVEALMIRLDQKRSKSSMVADRSGDLWVEEGYQQDPETPARRTVMNLDGAVLAVEVEVPPHFRPHWIEEELVLGVIRDELDVEYVHGYRLFR